MVRGLEKAAVREAGIVELLLEFVRQTTREGALGHLAIQLGAELPGRPPGLWLAERMMPPYARCSRITQETAAVDMIPAAPTRARAKPLPPPSSG